MALGDQFETVEQPIEAQLPIRCRHCQHFSTSPYYRISGALTVCSNERIGRVANDPPCPHFSPDMGFYRKMTPRGRELVRELLEEAGANATLHRGRKVDTKYDAERIADLSVIFRALANAKRQGFDFGAEYAVKGMTETGTLLSLAAKHAVVNVGGVPYTVPTEALSLVEQKDAA